MITCPSCRHSEVEGALFCSECGAQLVNMQNFVTQTIQMNEHMPEFHDDEATKNYTQTSEAISLQVLEGGHFLPLSERNEYTIGRISEGQSIMPDIDLTAYNAYENGVSRLHAVLKKNNKQITIMDLGSSNGTYLNGTRLTPEQEYQLFHGNIIAFGKLKLQFLLQE